MTPPAAAAAARTRTSTRRAAPARRVSGPVRPGAATVAAPPPLALRLGGAVHGLAEHHLLDRLVRGRAWIPILAVGLMGIVFMQVSMLRMNAGISAAVETTQVLERQNSALRATISEYSSGDRIAAEASKLGLVLPPGTPRFLDAREADAGRAIKSMTVPGEGIIPSTVETAPVVAPVSTVPVMDDTGIAADPTAPTTAEEPVAPATTDPAATTTPTADPAASTATPTATTTTEPAATAPPPTDPAVTGGVAPEA